MTTLIFLGKFAELAPPEFSQPVLPQHVRTLSDLQDWLAGRAPALGAAMAAARTRIVLNHELAHDLSRPIGGNDEIAFLPAMSGG